MHLFNKENIWSNPHSCNNNSVDRIISKEEEREDPRRDSSIYLQVQWCFHIPTRTTVLLHAIQQLQVILHTELILLQESSKKYYNYKAHPVQAPSSNCSPCLQAFYTAASIHAVPTVTPRPVLQVLHYRILPGEIGFIPKG